MCIQHVIKHLQVCKCKNSNGIQHHKKQILVGWGSSV